jgi:hypothetical protein
LADGQSVTVTASRMAASSYGSVIECNLATGEPTISVEGNDVPVGCTNPLSTLKSTDASGGFTTAFTVHTGTIGPPAQGTDSTGNAASADAAKYPCPPTPAQQAAGTTCDIVYGDTSGDQAKAPVTFAGSAQPSVASGGSSSSGTSSSSGSGASAPSFGSTASATGAESAGGGTSGTLAFTGFGPGMLWLGRVGVLLIALGALMMLAVAAPRAWVRLRRPA